SSTSVEQRSIHDGEALVARTENFAEDLVSRDLEKRKFSIGGALKTAASVVKKVAKAAPKVLPKVASKAKSVQKSAPKKASP
ncbi:7445_t:CDS:1, partial [Acaulospora colombiana]